MINFCYNFMFASNDLKREGGGRGNWGTTEDDIPA